MIEKVVEAVRNAPRLALHEVFSRSMLVIGYDDLGLAIGILLVLTHQPISFLFSAMEPGVVSMAVMTPLLSSITR